MGHPTVPRTRPEWVQTRFRNHYEEWRSARVNAIRAHYTDAFFANKTLLELGCGYGDIGAVFAGLGATVTCCDARDEHLQVLRERWPQITAVCADLNYQWPFGPFDIILNMGVIYHLEGSHLSLQRSCRSATHLVVETEVCDSSWSDALVLVPEKGYDQSIAGIGCRPSADRIEAIMANEGMRFERVRDGRCNGGMHVYDWPVTETFAVNHGQRRFWFAERNPL
jgi:SAM-dependent methyltransferase